PTFNAIQPANAGYYDAVVAKLNTSGGLIYSTYLGGSTGLNGADEAYGIAADATGSAYVTGETASSDFPVLNAFQPVWGGSYDGFVTKINPTGSALVYSTYLGGDSFDSGMA